MATSSWPADDREMRAQGEPDPLGRRSVRRDAVETGVERFRALPRDLPEQVLLRGDVVVERRLLHAELVRQVGERRALIAALGEEPGGGPGQLLSASTTSMMTSLTIGREARLVDARTQEFLAHVQDGGQVEATDWLPDDYRRKLIKFIEMHANSELMGVLPEREWILRAPTLQRKLALTAKVQDEVGHAQLIYRVAEDLGKPRDGDVRRPRSPGSRSSTTSSTTRRRPGAMSASSRGSSTPRRSSPRRRSSSARMRRTRGS